MDNGFFDVVILGTGLTESITAAALARAGFKVAHVDENPYYGGSEASLSLDELAQWADTQANAKDSNFTSIARSPTVLPQSRQYSICLCPSVIPSIGPIISSLISSGVSKYGGFRLLERVGIYHRSDIIRNVPGTKEEVFKNKDINLVGKRRLMRFLKFAAGDFENGKELEGRHNMAFPQFLKTVFSLNDEMAITISYSLAYCSSPSDHTLPALQRIRRYLRSAGRYGPSPFLVGHYGGLGEIAQGFCRSAAVSGGVYILGRRIKSMARAASPAASTSMPPLPLYSILLEDFPHHLACKVVISCRDHVPHHLLSDTRQLRSSLTYDNQDNNLPIARCIAIIDRPIYLPSIASQPDDLLDNTSTTTEGDPTAPAPHLQESQYKSQTDAAVLVFPPLTVTNGSRTTTATALITGESTMSTPKGRWILYISLTLTSSLAKEATAEALLEPYMNTILALCRPSTPPPQPLFTLFYIQHPISPLSPDISNANPTGLKTYIIPTPLMPAYPLPEVPDAAATHAEDVFWETVKILQDDVDGSKSKWVGSEDSIVDSEKSTIETFWPLSTLGKGEGEEDW